MDENIKWTKTLIQQFLVQGVENFCLSPGSRSTPLVLALAETPAARTHVHFDERGLGFFALGLAKATCKPTAVIVTSGTAVGNLMPAVMEASSAHIPLIILTADRPPLLRDTMANQTTDQIKIFGSHVRSFIELPTPQPHHEKYLATTVAHAVSLSQFPLPGPVHLNCPFTEPFFGKEESLPYDIVAPHIFAPELKCEGEKWAQVCSEIENGVIIVGASGGHPSLQMLAERLQWPVLADINSLYRHHAAPTTIPHYNHILRHTPELKADALFIFGDAVVSKDLMNWMKTHPRVIHIAPHHKRCDPHHCVTDRIICSTASFIKGVLPHLHPKKGWLSTWQQLADRMNFDEPALNEIGVVKWLCESLDSQTALFFANSMPIRDADSFFFPKKPTGPLFANRGLSGIDGNIATCAGIAHTFPLVAVVGDQTLLHDLNSIALLTKTPHPVKLIVINNGGGGIFSFLPIAEKKELLDPYFAASHSWEFSSIASLFNLPYYNPSTLEELNQAFNTKGSCIIEVNTDRHENVALHKLIDQKIKNQLYSHSHAYN